MRVAELSTHVEIFCFTSKICIYEYTNKRETIFSQHFFSFGIQEFSRAEPDPAENPDTATTYRFHVFIAGPPRQLLMHSYSFDSTDVGKSTGVFTSGSSGQTAMVDYLRCTPLVLMMILARIVSC